MAAPPLRSAALDAAVADVLLFFSVDVIITITRPSGTPSSSAMKRLITALVLLPIVVGVILAGGEWALTALLAITGLLAYYEFDQLAAGNGISTSYFQLYDTGGGKVAVTLNNFCKLQDMGPEDEDDILSCVHFLLVDVMEARRLLTGLV